MIEAKVSDQILLHKAPVKFFKFFKVFLRSPLSEFISSAEKLFTNLQVSLKSLKHDTAISFNFVLNVMPSKTFTERDLQQKLVFSKLD